MDKKYKVSVIVPVYGVEHFVERCVRSLMEQTLKAGIEYIFVDDATPDRSIEIIEKTIRDYPERTESVSIIRHNVNKGLPSARNTGLGEAKGEFIYHCDSDDFLELDTLECLYKEAVLKDCDFVWCDWYMTFNSKSRAMRQPTAKSPREALTFMLAGVMKYNVWNKLVKHTLYTENDIRFPDGKSMGEDMTMIRLAAKATKVSHITRPLYHYIRTNVGAMTQVYSAKHLMDLRENVAATCKFISDNCSDNDIEKEINWFKLNAKLPFLFNGKWQDIRLWEQCYTETHSDIMSNHYLSVRTRLLQWFAAHNMSVLNWIYSRLIFNLFYRILYK